MSCERSVINGTSWLFNLRDLGGLVTRSGAVTRTGAVYRSDSVQRATPAVWNRLSSLGVRTFIDLRTEAEIADYRFAGDVTSTSWHHMPLLQADWSMEEIDRLDSEAAAVEFLVRSYMDIARAAGGVIAASLRLVADGNNHPLLFHCAAGKDRTGVLAAVLLALLTVDDELIADDYHLSGQAMVAMMEWFQVRQP